MPSTRAISARAQAQTIIVSISSTTADISAQVMADMQTGAHTLKQTRQSQSKIQHMITCATAMAIGVTLVKQQSTTTQAIPMAQRVTIISLQATPRITQDLTPKLSQWTTKQSAESWMSLMMMKHSTIGLSLQTHPTKNMMHMHHPMYMAMAMLCPVSFL